MTPAVSTVRTAHRIALVGAGIGGSLSPALHEREAAALGLDYTYSLRDTDVEPGLTLRGAVADGVTGFNVTHPVKQTVIDELDVLSPDAAALGAVNTVLVRDGALVGHNTDHSGFLAGLRHGLPDAVLGRVAVIGAGGAGSAVAYALVGAGAAVRVVDADADRARALVARLRTAVPTSDVAVAGEAAPTVVAPESPVAQAIRWADGVVNATPIGMTGHPGVPFDPALLARRQWVAECIYRPRETALLTAARALGCPVLDGGAMLVAQAADSLALLTGADPDLARMRRHLGELTDV